MRNISWERKPKLTLPSWVWQGASVLLRTRVTSFLEEDGSAAATHQLLEIQRALSRRWSEWLTVGNNMGASVNDLLDSLFLFIACLGFAT